MSPLAAGDAGADRMLPGQDVLSGGLGALEAAAPVPAQFRAVSSYCAVSMYVAVSSYCVISTHASMTKCLVCAWGLSHT